MQIILLSAATLGLLIAPATASQCPAQMRMIDQEIKTAEISDDDRTKVMKLRAVGEERHNMGMHQESKAALGQALNILGM